MILIIAFIACYCVGFGFYLFYLVLFQEEPFWKVFIWPFYLFEELFLMWRDKE